VSTPTSARTNSEEAPVQTALASADNRRQAVLLDYLTASKRLHVLKTDAPLWTRHDRPKPMGEALTSHAFARNLKLYARKAGLGHVRLHQARHTYARIVAEEAGSMAATQDALDHADLSTTILYVQRISVKCDLYSAAPKELRSYYTHNFNLL
jgi:site-specific recombinase XerD